MSEVISRPSASRGRGSGRGGRGGFTGRGGRRTNGDKPDHKSPVDDTTSAFDDEGDFAELRKQYGAKTSVIREMFPDWSEADVLFALQETNGDENEAVTRIAEGIVAITVSPSMEHSRSPTIGAPFALHHANSFAQALFPSGAKSPRRRRRLARRPKTLLPLLPVTTPLPPPPDLLVAVVLSQRADGVVAARRTEAVAVDEDDRLSPPPTAPNRRRTNSCLSLLRSPQLQLGVLNRPRSMPRSRRSLRSLLPHPK